MSAEHIHNPTRHLPRPTDFPPEPVPPLNFAVDDFLEYISAINGNDQNDGFSRSLPLANGATTKTPAVGVGSTPTFVETAGGTTPLVMTPNAFVGLEIRVLHTLAPGIATSQASLIIGNTSTGFSLDPLQPLPGSPGFPSPVAPDTFVVVAPVKTVSETLKRIPAATGARCQLIFAKEQRLVPGQFGDGASFASIDSSGPIPLVTVTGLVNMTPASVGNALATGGAQREARFAAPVSPTPLLAAANNTGFFPIKTFLSATSVVIEATGATVQVGPFSWAEYQVYSVGTAVEGTKYNATKMLSRSAGAQALTIIGDYADQFLGTHSSPTAPFVVTGAEAAAGFANRQFTIAGVSPLAALGAELSQVPTIGVITPLSTSELIGGGQVLSGFVGLTPGLHKGSGLLICSGGGAGLMAEIVANDATTVTVTPSFPTVGAQAIVAGVTRMAIDLWGSKVAFLTGPAAGHRRMITGCQRGTEARIVAGAPAGQMRIDTLAGIAPSDAGAFILIRGAFTGTTNALFPIVTVVNSTTVEVTNAVVTVTDLNNDFLNWRVVGGATFGVDVGFAAPAVPTAAGGDQLRVEHAAMEHRGTFDFSMSDLMAVKAMKVIGNQPANRILQVYGSGATFGWEGLEFSARGGQLFQNVGTLFLSASGGPLAIFGAGVEDISQRFGQLGPNAVFSPVRRGGYLQIGGTNEVWWNANQILCTGMYSFVGITIRGNAQWFMAHLRGSRLRDFPTAMMNMDGALAGNIAPIRGTMDASNPGAGSIFNVSGSVGLGQASSPMSKYDITNAQAHGIIVSDGAFLDCSDVRGSGNVTSGIRIQRQGRAQIRSGAVGTGTRLTGDPAHLNDGIANVDVLLGANTPAALTRYPAIAALVAPVAGVNDYDNGPGFFRPDASAVGPYGNFTGCRVEKVSP